MCQVIMSDDERRAVVAAIKFVTEKGINSLKTMPNTTSEDKDSREAALLLLINDLSKWFEDIDTRCAKMLYEETFSCNDRFLVKAKKDAPEDIIVSSVYERDYKNLLSKSRDIFKRMGYAFNLRMFLKLV